METAMHQQGSSFDLSNLQRNCIFRCESPMESHEKIAHELADHDLRWRRGAVDTGMYKVGVHALEMFMLHYGAEVEVRPRVPEGFALVHLSLKGAIDIISDEQRITVSPGEVAYLAPRKNFRMLWQRGAQQLILKVPDTLLRSIVAEAGACLDLPSTMRLTPAAARQWHLFMQSLLNIGTAPNELRLDEGWVDHFEKNIAFFLLSQRPSQQRPRDGVATASPPVLIRSSSCTGGTSSALERLEAMERYIRRHLCAPVGVIDLARAAGVSVRTLNIICREYRRETPMQVLRNIRLDAARSALLLNQSVSVTQAAFDYGFGHLGRFSAYYKERFGELPSLTSSQMH
ncbi:AraC family transcriptional regulator [Sphingomonas sp. C8-2]|uniref:HTH araC/xylS-type domain-containing protein n=6 Tax=Burkholderiales TaxID=80840 RepID=Q8RL38_DELAC|nr:MULTISPECIES: AraC family transcriptional regulator [Burkholderiales]AAL86584.1 hypothetical protein [Delftia acidovorans]QEH80964.1 AraC family transcriptional regulator [Sphingomonas sp. C8-2]